MSDGTDNYKRRMNQVLQNFSVDVEALQVAPAGLSLSVPANHGPSCSTRNPAMTLARSAALHAAQKPTIPATHE